MTGSRRGFLRVGRPRAEGKGGHDGGFLRGSRVGWEQQCLGIGIVTGAKAFPRERGVRRWQGADRALWWRCSGCVQGSPPSPFFLAKSALSSPPPYPLLPFSPIIRSYRPSSDILTSYLTARAGRQGRRLQCSLFASRNSPSCVPSLPFQRLFAVSWGAVTVRCLPPPHPLSG